MYEHRSTTSSLTIRAIIVVLAISACVRAIPQIPPENEVVMTEGMKISASNGYGTLTVTAGKGLERSYTWAGDTRSVMMWPRKERWNGSLGIYFPGEGNHWKEHDGITRAVVEEGQLNFKSQDDLVSYIARYGDRRSYVYNDNGLFVSWNKFPGAGGTLSVLVWQFYINGEKPTRLAGSQNEKIVVEYPNNRAGS